MQGFRVCGVIVLVVAVVSTVLPVLANEARAEAAIEPLVEPQMLDATGFQDILVRVAPKVYLAGQPSEAGLESLRERGVVRVVNLRTHEEMENRNIVPFDERDKLAQLGIEYVHIPLGGPDTPYSPSAIDELAQAMSGAQGDVLVHCTVAWRASHLWAAYLVRDHAYSVAEAVALGKQINMGGYPFAEFLGREISLTEPRP